MIVTKIGRRETSLLFNQLLIFRRRYRDREIAVVCESCALTSDLLMIVLLSVPCSLRKTERMGTPWLIVSRHVRRTLFVGRQQEK